MARCPAEVVLQDHSGRLPVETLLACACVSPHWRTLATAALEQRRELRVSDDFNVERQTMALVQLPALLRRMPSLRFVAVDPAHAHVTTHEHLLACSSLLSARCHVLRFTNNVALADPTVCGYNLEDTPAALRPPQGEPQPYPVVDFESPQFLGPVQAAVQRGFQLWTAFSVRGAELRDLQLPAHARGIWQEVDEAMGIISNEPENWERRLFCLAALPRLSLFTLRDGYWLNLEREHLLSLAAALVQRPTRMRGLVLGPQEELDDEVVAALASACPSLEVFEAASPAIGPAGIAALLRACPRLTCLGAFSEDMENEVFDEDEGADGGDVRWSSQQWQAMLDALRDAPCLVALDLSGWHIPGAVAAALPAACARLTIIGLGAVTLADDVVAAFQASCPSLRVMHLTCADDEEDEEEEEEVVEGPGVSKQAIQLLSAAGVQVMGDQPVAAGGDNDYWTPYWHRTVMDMWSAGLDMELRRTTHSGTPLPSPSVSR